MTDIDGSLADAPLGARLDTPATGAAGYGFYGYREDGLLVFAISADAEEVGAGTTIWLDTDLDRSTGYQIWGFAGGAEFNVDIDAGGRAALYSGGAGQTFVAELDHAYSADGRAIELAIDPVLLDGAEQVRVLADVNDVAFLPNDYSNVDIVVGAPPAVVAGDKTLDGDLSEWGPSTRLDDAATGTAGYALHGDRTGGSFQFAISADAVQVGTGTTIWLDTDLDRSTGYQIWGFTGGAEFNVNVGADGRAALYTGGAGQTFVTDIDHAYSADGRTIELAIDEALLGGATRVRVLADANDAAFLPNDFANIDLLVGEDAPTPPAVDQPGLRVGIVYSETTAANFYSETAYGQLVMSAQNQAMQAGIPFDLLGEDDLRNPSGLAAYDLLVFPGFSHVPAADLAAVTATLEAAQAQFGTGLLVAGNFLTNDETGAALPGDSYARMKSLLGVTLEGFGQTQGLGLEATGSGHPMLDGYAAGEAVGDYTNASFLHFTDVSGGGQVLFELVVQAPGGAPERHDAVIATETGGRNVHFATDAIIGNNSILKDAIGWAAADVEPEVRLALTRQESLFYSRNDMDQSQEAFDVIDTDPGIYDAMLPILEDYYDRYGFVGSHYVNVGAYGPDQRTDWSVSKPYYDRLLALESEIGSHSYTHPHDTNLLLPDTVTQALIDQRVLAYADAVEHGTVCWCPYCTRDDAEQDVMDALAAMDAAQINAVLASALGRTDPRDPGAVDPATLDPVERAVLEASYRFQFEYSKLVIEREMGIDVVGAAVPGMPERTDATREIIQYYDYVSGGYSGTGAGYPGAFGFLSPDETERVYLAPNMSFDFTLIGFQGLTAAQAEAAWLAEYEALTDHARTPIVAFPWHDYGLASWDIGSPDDVYTEAMFEAVIARAHADGAEFVTGADLAARIGAFADSTLTAARSGDVLTVTVDAQGTGRFALDVSDEGTIASVAGWYAYDGTKVFLPETGRTFEVALGATPDDVTRVTALGQRAVLLDVSGNGSDLDLAFEGGGTVEVALRTQGAELVRIAGADGARVVAPGGVSLDFDAAGRHDVALRYEAAGTALVAAAGGEVLLGGTGDDALEGASGDDVLRGGGGSDEFTFRPGGGEDVVLDFHLGSDRARLVGLGFADAQAAAAALVGTVEGARLDVGGDDAILFAGVEAALFSASDFLVEPAIFV